MVVAEQEPTGDEDADFADMLRKFKQGVAENVDAEDYQSHYDLAIAFKEMGLLDEAIAEFQKALGSPTNRLPTYEALGQCFLEKDQFKLASSILSRALNERATEEQLVGVLVPARAAPPKLQGKRGRRARLLSTRVRHRHSVPDIAERMSEVERAPDERRRRAHAHARDQRAARHPGAGARSPRATSSPRCSASSPTICRSSAR